MFIFLHFTFQIQVCRRIHSLFFIIYLFNFSERLWCIAANNLYVCTTLTCSADADLLSNFHFPLRFVKNVNLNKGISGAKTLIWYFIIDSLCKNLPEDAREKNSISKFCLKASINHNVRFRCSWYRHYYSVMEMWQVKTISTFDWRFNLFWKLLSIYLTFTFVLLVFEFVEVGSFKEGQLNWN
jgi:hypothetical protein